MKWENVEAKKKDGLKAAKKQQQNCRWDWVGAKKERELAVGEGIREAG